MRGYNRFIIIFSLLLILYVVVELNKPKPIDWRITLSNTHKTPYGGYVISQRLRDIFPNSSIQSYRTPIYSQVNNFDEDNTAYILIEPFFNSSAEDEKELRNYVSLGNYAFISSGRFTKSFADTLGFKVDTRFTLQSEDSTHINFTNPAIRSAKDYTFLRSTIDNYFSTIDTSKAVVLGINDRKESNFIKIHYGDGAFFIHANPLCFSNYFILNENNATYTAKALSYIPEDVSRIYWDEYYKLGREGARNPLRFLLSNEYLRWAFRIAVAGILLYILFQVKRKQRIIPVINPLRNTTIDFIKTVAGVYFNAKDNNGIAERKINFFMEFIRHRFNIATTVYDDDFKEQLARKSGVERTYINELVMLVSEVPEQQVSDKTLIMLNNRIDNFYKLI